MTIEELKTQLTATEKEREQALAVLYRCDGGITMLQHIISETEKAAQASTTVAHED